MRYRRLALGLSGAAVVAAASVLSPAVGASNTPRFVGSRVSLGSGAALGSFTPASTDPRLSAMLARSGLSASGFRFTPATVSLRLNRAVTVAVRARTTGTPVSGERSALVSQPVQGIAPIAYNLGVAVGWKRFALSGDVAKVDLGTLGGREAVDVGVSYNARRWSTRLAVGADHATPDTPRALQGSAGYSVDVAGSYSLTRNIDLTAGVRYRAAEGEQRLAPVADNRRDSQAVYIGTAFKF